MRGLKVEHLINTSTTFSGLLPMVLTLVSIITVNLCKTATHKKTEKWGSRLIIA